MYPNVQVQVGQTAPQSAAQHPLTRREFRRIMNAVQRANAPGKDARIVAAQAKRDRRNAKRAAVT